MLMPARFVLAALVQVGAITFVCVVFYLFTLSFLNELRLQLPQFASHVEIPVYLSHSKAKSMLHINFQMNQVASYYLTHWRELKDYYYFREATIGDDGVREEDRLGLTYKYYASKMRDASTSDELNDLDFILISLTNKRDYCMLEHYLNIYWPKLKPFGLVLIHKQQQQQQDVQANNHKLNDLYLMCENNLANKNNKSSTTFHLIKSDLSSLIQDFLYRTKIRHFRQLTIDNSIYFRKL